MNGCPKEEMLSALLDGELTAPELEAAEAHLAACPTCATTTACLREAQALSAELTEEPVTREEWDQAWAGILERIDRPRPIGLLRRFLVPLAGAAVLMLALGLWAILPGRGGDPVAVVVDVQADCLVDSLETAEGYTSMYQEADVTIITLLQESPEEAPSPDDTL